MRRKGEVSGRRPKAIIPPTPTRSQLSKKLKPIKLQVHPKYQRSTSMRIDAMRKTIVSRVSIVICLLLLTIFTISSNVVQIAYPTDFDEIPEYLYIEMDYQIPASHFALLGNIQQLPFIEYDEIETFEIEPIEMSFLPFIHPQEMPEEIIPDQYVESGDWYPETEYPCTDIEEYEYAEEYEAYVVYIPSSPPPNLAGQPENVQIVMDFFLSHGVSEAAVAGIIGNLRQETTNINPYHAGVARGIAQWEGDRFPALQRFAADRGTVWYDLDIQLQFMWHEMVEGPHASDFSHRMQGSYADLGGNWPQRFQGTLNNKGAYALPGGMVEFLQMDCWYQATRIFDAAYHRSGTPNMPRRLRFAEEAYLLLTA